MSSENFLKTKLQQLEEDQAVLVNQWAAVAGQLRLTLDPDTGVVLQAKKDRLERLIGENEKEQEVTKAELKTKHGGQGHPAPASDSGWEQHLPAIDYKQARGIARDALDLLEQSQGGVFFLLQRSTEMGGRWCLDGIKYDYLKAEIDSGKLISHPIKFMAWQRPNEFEFLSKLAERLGTSVAEGDMEASARGVIEKLCSSVQIGGALVIEVTFISSDSLHAGLLRWIVEKFWCALADSLLALAHKRMDFRVILAVIANGAVAPECLAAHLGCLEAGFDFRKILELPLEKWTKGDIRRWLGRYFGRYSGLELTGPEFDQLAETIYRNSGEGVPASVRQALMQEFSPGA